MHRNTFKKCEHLCSKKEIESLVKKANVTQNSFYKVLWNVCPSENETNTPSQIALSVSKRNFKRAVDRNFLKRRTREAYRKNKHALLSVLKECHLQIKMLIIYTRKDINEQAVIEENVIHSLRKIENEIVKRFGSNSDNNMADKATVAYPDKNI